MEENNILFTSNLGDLGGGEMSMLLLMNEIKDKVNVELLCASEGIFPEEARKLGIPVSIYNFKQKNIAKTFFYFERLIKEKKINVVHNNELSTSLLFGFFMRIRGQSVRNYWTCHGQWYTFTQAKRLLTNFTIDNIFCVSNNVYENLKSQGIKNLLLTYLGVELKTVNEDIYDLHQELRLNNNTFLIGTVARFEQIKGQKKAIYAMEKIMDLYPNVHYLLVGGYRKNKEFDEKYFQESIATINNSKHADRIHIMGERHNIARIMKELDLLLVPSDSESLSLVTLEALVQGTPVISTPCEGPQEILDNNELLITKRNSAESIFELLNSYLSDPSIQKNAKEITLKLKSKVDRQFNIKNVSRKYMAIFVK